MSKIRDNSGTTKFSIVVHGFWKYPILMTVLLVAIITAGVWVGSPNWPRATIKNSALKEPGGTIWAVSQELDGTSVSYTNPYAYGMKNPAQRLVIGPLKSAKWFLSQEQRQALSTYINASVTKRIDWAKNYDKAIQKTFPVSKSDYTPVPKISNISMLKGNFGPIPVIADTILELAQKGYLETYFQGISPGNVFEYTNIWLYDRPYMLNTAIKNGLTDDQWGMIKERGFAPGPWYLVIPAVFHVKFPDGSTGPGFIFWNSLLALFVVVLFPLIPGLRNIPKYTGLYKLIYAVDPKKSEHSEFSTEGDHNADNTHKKHKKKKNS